MTTVSVFHANMFPLKARFETFPTGLCISSLWNLLFPPAFYVNIFLTFIISSFLAYWYDNEWQSGNYSRSQREHSKDSPEQKREQFRALLADAVGPFVFGRSERLVNELELFLVSSLNIEAYDEVYLQCLGADTSGATSGTAEDNHERTSQVPCLHLFDEDIDNRTDWRRIFIMLRGNYLDRLYTIFKA